MTVDIEFLRGKPWAILEGDCAKTLAALPNESVDACVTDTPYGLSTLLDPPNLDREALWQKLTSGAKEAPIKTLMRAWLDTGDNPVMKGRGFMGKEWDALVPSPNTWRAVWRALKPGAYCFAFGGTRTADLVAMSLRFADFEVEDMLAWMFGQGFPKRVRLDLKIDQHFGAQQRIEGDLRRTGRDRNSAQGSWHMAAGGTAKAHAATPDAARFVGWDRALRPGFEPIIIACKPLRGTVAETALRYGTGGLHVDACRLERGDGGPLKWDATRGMGYAADGSRKQGIDAGPCGFTQDARGGYPANVALDEEMAAELDRMSGPVAKDGEGASAFFYTAKASSSERDAGLDDLPPLTPGERCGRKDGSAGINAYAGTNGDGGRSSHPTVKPIALMRWLVRLASPPGAHDPDIGRRPVILDPFFGSGSTGVAAMAEGVRVIGCEMMPEYVEIARRRMQHAYALPPDDAEVPKRRVDTPGQKTLF